MKLMVTIVWGICFYELGRIVGYLETVGLVAGDSIPQIEETSQESVYPGFDNLSEFRWSNRLVIVFAPSYDSELLQRQRKVIRCNQRGYQDRDLRVIEVIGNEVRLDGLLIDSPSAVELRIRFGVSNDEFQSRLIGRDGGSKVVTEGVLESDFLFDQIDVMPMRRQEIASQGFSVPSVDC
eukprot:TRINITY_DN21301_c0_g1_i1.p2 TRINITY_DN21301_c0_g1~~TRINITY_DN21301_c0_g1_i1.p2  ORF type:complete len:180 (+),score=19.41 TRINITY_DN21301_c0_g1_i1:242-781(+)